MNVSIILPLYKPNQKILKEIRLALEHQNKKGKVEVLEINEGLGLADSLNFGIRKAKYPIAISLHQDCIPQGNNWLEKLISPLKEEGVVASVSKVELPKTLWKSFDSISKILSLKEQKELTPLMDEKGCAYRRDVLLKVGLFDGKNYRTAGEDFDMYLKLKSQGVIAYPAAKVTHYHAFTWKSRLKKEFQLSNAFGALVRIHRKDMPSWYFGLIKAVPFLGYPLFFKGISPSSLGLGRFFLAFPLFLLVNFIYSYGFWKGFLMKRQTV